MKDRPRSRPLSLAVPKKHIVSVENPCLVKNVDKAIKMLGGGSTIGDISAPGSERTLGLSFRPEDPSLRTVVSFNTKSNNVLLKIIAPKRVGKRKRGLEDAFTPLTAEDENMNVRHLLRSLQDHQDVTQITALGKIESTHVWRAMPDHVYALEKDSKVEGMRSKVFSGRYEVLRTVNPGEKRSPSPTEIMPPPAFSTVSLPQPYGYRQAD